MIMFALAPTPVQASFENNGYTWQQQDFRNYIQKLSAQNNAFAMNFEAVKLSHKIQQWIQMVDFVIHHKVRTKYDADFDLSFDKQGNVNSISLIELRENNPVKFKKFVAEIFNWQAPPLPVSLSPQTKFKLNGKWLHIERGDKPQPEIPQPRRRGSGRWAEISASQLESQKYISQSLNIDGDQEVELNLLKPNFIDYPRIGEKILFTVRSGVKGIPLGSILRARIVDVNKKHMTLLSSKIKSPSGETLTQDFVWQVPANGAVETKQIIASMTSGAISSAAAIGIGPGLATNGIANGGAAALGAVAGLLKEKQKIIAYNLSSSKPITAKYHRR